MLSVRAGTFMSKLGRFAMRSAMHVPLRYGSHSDPRHSILHFP